MAAISVSSGHVPEISLDTRDLVRRLCTLFRRHGPDIIRGALFLGVSWDTLEDLLAAFNILQSHSVVEQKLLMDLEYLVNMVESVPCLQLSNSRVPLLTPRVSLDWVSITGFKNISQLVMSRVPLYYLCGLRNLRHQIVTVKVTWCATTLEDLLQGCLGDQLPHSQGNNTRGAECVWPALTSLSLTHTQPGLVSLGGPPTLSLVPNLHTLVLTHNRLTIIDGLECLPSLHTLLLGYNSLTQIPRLSAEANLTTLTLNYNRLERLAGLEQLVSLETLDLAGNILMHHDALAPVSALARLKQLDLRYNPIASYPSHRMVCSSWLNDDVVNSSLAFILDTKNLSSREFTQIGTSRLMVTPRSEVVEDDEENGRFNDDTTSLNNLNLESASARGSREGSLASASVATTSGKHKKRKSKKKTREVVIADQPTDSEAEARGKPESAGPEDQNAVWETARQLEQLRAKYGEENWLRERAGERLQEFLGIEPVNKSQSGVATVVKQVPEEQRKPLVRVKLTNQKLEADVHPTPSSPNNTVPADIQAKDLVVADVHPDISAEDQSQDHVQLQAEDEDQEALSNSFYSLYKREEKESSPQTNTECRITVQRSVPGDDSGLVECLFLVIDKEFIREVEESTSTRAKWFLHSLETCDMLDRSQDGGKTVTAQLLFNTVRKDCRERTYRMTEADYARLVAATGSQLEQAASRCLEDNLTSLQCVKCQSIFSQELAEKGRRRKRSLEICCINCGSNMVIEVRDEKLREGRSGRTAAGVGDSEEDGEGVAVGIPVCEALDLDSMQHQEHLGESKRGGNIPQSQTDPGGLQQAAGGKISVRQLSVQADIHTDHVVRRTSTSEMPDLLPAQAHQAFREGQKNSRSPSVQRSESSSDISVISDGSIEVLNSQTAGAVGQEEEEEATSPHNLTMQASDSTTHTMAGSSSMVSSSSSSSATSQVMLKQEEKDKSDTDKSSSRRSSGEDGEASSLYHSCVSTEDMSHHTEDRPQHTEVMSSQTAFTREKTLEPEDREEGERESRNPSPAFSIPAPAHRLSCSGEGRPSPNTSTPFAGNSPSTPTPHCQERSEDGASPNLSTVKKRSSGPNSPLTGSPGTNTNMFSLPQGGPEVGFTASPPPLPTGGRRPGIITWNYQDFTVADHRVQLFCELSLFNEEGESLIVLVKSEVFVKSQCRVLDGVLVMSNRKLYLLQCTQQETEEPSDWLELVEAVSVLRLERLVRLLGGQGLGIEVSGSDEGGSSGMPSSASYFSRPRFGSSAGSGGKGMLRASKLSAATTPTSGTEGECFYVILRDGDRTVRLADQLVDGLQERVRSNPIPLVTDLHQEEEGLLHREIDKIGDPDMESHPSAFLLAYNSIGESISVIATTSHLVLAEDFFSWVFLAGKEKPLRILDSIPIHSIHSLAVYQSYPGRVTLSNTKISLDLRLETEREAQSLVRTLRPVWELAHPGQTLEDKTSYHLTGSRQILRMGSLMAESMAALMADSDNSLDRKNLSHWIKVTREKL